MCLAQTFLKPHPFTHKHTKLLVNKDPCKNHYRLTQRTWQMIRRQTQDSRLLWQLVCKKRIAVTVVGEINSTRTPEAKPDCWRLRNKGGQVTNLVFIKDLCYFNLTCVITSKEKLRGGNYKNTLFT